MSGSQYEVTSIRYVFFYHREYADFSLISERSPFMIVMLVSFLYSYLLLCYAEGGSYITSVDFCAIHPLHMSQRRSPRNSSRVQIRVRFAFAMLDEAFFQWHHLGSFERRQLQMCDFFKGEHHCFTDAMKRGNQLSLYMEIS
jgi:hypothetical protein